MISEDLALGRLLRFQNTNVTTLLAGASTFGANMQRIGVNIANVGPALAGAVTVTISISGTKTFQLSSGITFVHYDCMQFGDMPTKSISIVGTSDGTIVSVVEWFAPEEYIAACLCAFNLRMGIK